MLEQLFTIGVFGKSEAEFFGALERAGVTTLCDIRRRRGVRGHEYSFANSNYLQAELAKRHIAYRYVPELAPTQDMRELQNSADAEAGVSIRRRRKLSEEFKRRYTAEVLGRFDSRSFIENFRGSAERAALFCVEGEAGACHRSLAAKKLHVDLKLPVEHL